MMAALVAGGQLCIASTANAQAQSPEIQSPVAPQIPDHKLDAAATAMMEVNRLQPEYQEQVKRIAEDANKAVEKAVTDRGLSVDEFKTIIVAAQNDPDVRKKLLQHLPKNE
jgi:hypothetical protein